MRSSSALFLLIALLLAAVAGFGVGCVHDSGAASTRSSPTAATTAVREAAPTQTLRAPLPTPPAPTVAVTAAREATPTQTPRAQLPTSAPTAVSAGRPTAEFSAFPVLGRPGSVVYFYDESAGAITAWLWDLGDGATSTERNPRHVYKGDPNQDLFYTVKLYGSLGVAVILDISGHAPCDFAAK
jgi:PKD repeat protein